MCEEQFGSVIETGAGVCHTYVEKEADIDKAVAIVVNEKTTRPSVCNSLDSLLVDKSIAKKFLQKLLPEFEKFGVEIFADATAYSFINNYPFKQKQLLEILTGIFEFKMRVENGKEL
jgi:glutamate-5-semialdehyde dehydrogenase